MLTITEDLRARGLIHQVTDEALFDRLDAGGLCVYAGFDPTADSLHIGHLLQLCTLRRLQLAGHRPIALAGGGTGMIGDPGGKSAERPLLSVEDIATNVEAIRGQLARFLDFDDSAGSSQAFTVNQMVAKESVRSRLERPDQGITYTEFSYMLLQAYDFARLNEDHGCTLQIGGSDQWGNITMGIELIHRRSGGEAYGLTAPLVTKADGTKFGKSESGNESVWLDAARTSPYRLYQFLLGVEDAMVGTYLRYFTFLDLEEIAHQRHARAQARGQQALVHGADQRDAAIDASAALFGGRVSTLDEATLLDVINDVPTSSISATDIAPGLLLVDLLVTTGLAASKGEARRTVEQNGAFVNDVVRTGLDAEVSARDLLHGRYVVLRKGKRNYHLVTVT